MRPFTDPAVERAYAAFPAHHHAQLLALRDLVLDTAARLDLPGGVRETLKWGEPSYLPAQARLGTTVRVGSFDEQHVALYVHCQTTLVGQWRALFEDRVGFSNNRAVLFDVARPLPEHDVRLCAQMALLYHRDKRG